ncbi:DUF1918 domain-containing protein [Acrocarpospora catenulata]|uniref:DUF1918 domain-containing protein n=1 Tax=Acrocarpospora catenulata TaxID=2836182 RepID=UPI001BDA5487|nr:DUF1918 domain-containing protein [Acrocarpospora catenulata]
MHAEVGDKLIVEGTHQGEPQRIGIVRELRHEDGTPPYVVHWLGTDQETLVYPGPDAHVVHGEA